MEPLPAFNEETRSTGAITLDNYWQYLRAGASYFSLVSFAIIFLIAQLLFIGSDYWLTLWTNAEELRYLRNLTETNVTEPTYLEMNMAKSSLSDFTTTDSSFMDYLTAESSLMDMNSTDVATTISDWIKNIDTKTGIYVYSIMIGALFIFTMIRTTHFFLMCMASSVKLHNKMFESIIRAKLVFFDQNPVGKQLF